jgi:hypothetical protein
MVRPHRRSNRAGIQALALSRAKTSARHPAAPARTAIFAVEARGFLVVLQLTSGPIS